MTIDAMTLQKQSGKTFGQIKSRVLEGPASCWYAFVPSGGQRVELQIYRVVSVGRYNGTGCEGGSLRLMAGRDPTDNQPPQPAFELCGANERYTPPVVLFSDHADQTRLLFVVDERTLRSQFLAYFSFTSSEATAPGGPASQLAYQPRGGTRLHSTDCDWLYQDFSCGSRAVGEQPSCVMASPGYPGAYPPNRVCNYYVTTSSMSTRVRFVFHGLLLPHGRCDTDYVAIYQGATRQSPHLHTFCGSRQRQPQEVEYAGPNLLLEFSSGPAQPPFNYNGFLLELRFEEGTEEATSDRQQVVVPPDEPVQPLHSSPPTSTAQRGNCDVTLHENESRSGHFDTRSHDWSQLCRFVFRGRPTDVVHVSLFNYKLRSRSCNTVIEIWDGVAGGSPSSTTNRRHKPMHKICSPQTRYARDHGGSFLEHQTFVSSGPSLTLAVRRTAGSSRENSGKDLEFVDGAFLFHDEQTLGTLQPSTICDVSFYGLSSPAGGTVSNPGGQHLYWNVEGALRCTQQFVPAANQSVAVSVRSLGRLTVGQGCETRCGDTGCECAPDPRSNRPYDHLMLQSEEGRTLACLCGAHLDTTMMPVTVRSWTQLTLVYSVAGYSWNTKGFDFSATYAFERDASCGLNTVMAQSGEIRSEEVNIGHARAANVSVIAELNHFYHQSCVWILDSNVERQLFIDLASNQSRPCGAWNISVHEYSPATDDATHLGELLYTFCPRDRHKTYSLPWKLNTVVVRLRVMSRTPPQFRIKWRSQVVRANTRLASPTPAPNAASSAALLAADALMCLLSLLLT